MTPSDLIDDVVYGYSPRELIELHHSPTMVMYHGTSSKFLREILKKGLIPNPRMRVWKDDPAAQRYASQVSRKALDSVYFTKNFMTAVSAGGDASRKFGGTYLFIAAQIQPRSAFADEDTLKIRMEHAIRDTLGYSSDNVYAGDWFNIIVTGWKQVGEDFARKLSDQLSRTGPPFGLGKRGEKIPIDIAGATDTIRGYIEKQVAVRYKEEGDKWLAGRLWATDLVQPDSSEEKKQEVLKFLKRNLVSYAEAEKRYFKGVDKLTRHYKGLAMPGPGEFDWFTHTLRIPETVAYSGKNKIVAVFQTRTVSSYEKEIPAGAEVGTSYVITHYGHVTSEILSDMKRGSGWISGKNVKIITAAEAKKMPGLLKEHNEGRRTMEYVRVRDVHASDISSIATSRGLEHQIFEDNDGWVTFGLTNRRCRTAFEDLCREYSATVDGYQDVVSMLDAVRSGLKPSDVLNEALTKGMKNFLAKNRPKYTCDSCGLNVPTYSGRYPASCPECGGSLNSSKA